MYDLITYCFDVKMILFNRNIAYYDIDAVFDTAEELLKQYLEPALKYSCLVYIDSLSAYGLRFVAECALSDEKVFGPK